jgi:bifunctional NMN adenylyltransferase/nudix hydrolase
LKLFPCWPAVSVPVQGDFNSTACRNGFYELTYYTPTEASTNLYKSTTPQVVSYISQWMIINHEQYVAFQHEHAFIKNYKKSWEAAPFPPTFNTVDAVVFHKHDVLVIKRGDHPGKGLFAVPGGFLNPQEEQVDACLRELKEETGLRIAYPEVDYGVSVELAPWIVEEKTFGAPGRDPRGRTITQAFCLCLPNACAPIIEAGDDAAEVMWLPVKDVDPRNFIADHAFMIQYFAEKYIV